jgi:hypothetical protein
MFPMAGFNLRVLCVLRGYDLQGQRLQARGLLWIEGNKEEVT